MACINLGYFCWKCLKNDLIFTSALFSEGGWEGRFMVTGLSTTGSWDSVGWDVAGVLLLSASSGWLDESVDVDSCRCCTPSKKAMRSTTSQRRTVRATNCCLITSKFQIRLGSVTVCKKLLRLVVTFIWC